jgi:dihydropyrimidinase
MSDMVLAGGTVVTAEASFRADLAIEDERIAAVGVDLPTDGAEVVDVSGALVMPGFIDGHTHLDMPFGGTVTSDDWDTGTAAAIAGGTTTNVDFSLQDIDGTLAEAVETWQAKAEGKARMDYGLHVAITNLTDAVKAEIPSLPSLGVSTIKIFMAYKGTPLFTADEDLFEAMQIAREAGVLVLVHAENGDVIAKLQAEALERGDTDPHWHALTRPELVEAEATNRAIRLAELADTPLLVVHVSCAAALEEVRRAHARGSTIYAETCPQYFVFEYKDLERPNFEGAKYVCSPPMRDPSNRPALWRGPAGGRPADLRLGPLLVQLARAEGAGARRLHADPQRPARARGAPGRAVDRGRARRPHLRAALRRLCCRPTRRASTAWWGARARSPRGTTPTSSSGTPT